jgi:hypothetical protein
MAVPADKRRRSPRGRHGRPQLQPPLERVRRLPVSVQPLVLAGASHADYRIRATRLYLERVERIASWNPRLAAVRTRR